jgi:hypothetical protein
MIILIKNIPSDAMPAELCEFISPALRGGAISGRDCVKNTELMIIYDKRTQAFEFNGLVYLRNPLQGFKVIQKMNGKLFKGKAVTVRKYIQRRTESECPTKDMTVSNVRNLERRRIENEHVLRFSSYEYIDILPVSEVSATSSI